MKMSVHHVTRYRYSEPVTLAHHIAHLTPRSDNGQVLINRALDVTPAAAVRRERTDAFGNRATYFSIEEPHLELTVDVACEVDVPLPSNPPLHFTRGWESVRDQVRAGRLADTLEAFSYTFDSPFVAASAALRAYAAPSFGPGRPVLDAVMDLTRRIHDDFIYDPGATDISTPLATVFEARRGVCQDFAHLQIGCLRAMGLAARYVSGYLVTRPPPGRPRLQGADASHAWVSVYLPDFGWVDFDPTNSLMPADHHVTLAYGRDFADVTALRGVILGGGPHQLTVEIDVVPA